MGQAALEVRRLVPEDEVTLRQLFHELREERADRYFHPHGFDEASARRICRFSGADLYYALVNGRSILAYGMLRGWDEGFAIPSLGIVVAPRYRGQGYGRVMMNFLHAAARVRGARRIRLKVHPGNNEAMGLYQSLGYVFGASDGEQLVGYLDL